MKIIVERVYEVEWLDEWNDSGWHLIKQFETLEEAIKCAREEKKKSLLFNTCCSC